MIARVYRIVACSAYTLRLFLPRNSRSHFSNMIRRRGLRGEYVFPSFHVSSATREDSRDARGSVMFGESVRASVRIEEVCLATRGVGRWTFVNVIII